MTLACPNTEVLAAWLENVHAGSSQPIAQHVQACEACTARVKQLRGLTQTLERLVLARAEPGFATALASKLTAQSNAAPNWQHLFNARLFAGSLALCSALIGVLYTLSPADPRAGYSARGGSIARAARVGFEVYAHQAGREVAAVREGQQLSTETGYSFIVFNRSHQRQYLMLFALDAQNDLHWFYPAYLDAALDPEALLLQPKPQVRALPEGITPENPAPGPIRFVGVFSPAALFVHEVEALVQAGGLDALAKAHRDADIHVLRAELRAGSVQP